MKYVEVIFMARHYEKPDQKHGSPEGLLKWANECKNQKQSRRFLCIRDLMLKGERTTINDAAQTFGVSPRTVRQWIRQWNENGKEGLTIKPQPGRYSLFLPEHEDKIREMLENQANSSTRLTAKRIHDFLKEQF